MAELSHPTHTVGGMEDNDRLVLEIADRFYLSPGSRETTIRDELGLSPIRFYQRLNQLLDDPRAAVECPEIVHRLRRIKAQRLRLRRRRVA